MAVRGRGRPELGAVTTSHRRGKFGRALQLRTRRRSAVVSLLICHLPPCALLPLQQVEAQDQLETARDAGDAAVVARLLQRRPGDPLDLFEQAIALACCAGGGGSGGHGESGVQNGGGILENGDSKLTAAAHAAGGGHVAAEPAANREAAQLLGAPTNGAASALPAANGGSAAAAANGGGGSTSSGEGDPGLQWYVYSCVAAYLARRAEFLASCAAAQLLPAGVLLEQAEQQPKQEQPPQQAAEQQAAEQQQQQQQQEPELAPAQQGWWCQAATTYRQGLEAAGRGGGVLARYRVSPATGGWAARQWQQQGSCGRGTVGEALCLQVCLQAQRRRWIAALSFLFRTLQCLSSPPFCRLPSAPICPFHHR